ncbi:daunorubicin resistance protein DrrA family ABC transporter ATP-binding protein [Lentzea sp. NBRC 105346]|uniref:ABC transporter ATP-binding protein n=1 Tax=Lentzea sp. NBRC 105346 TaxID=3032205 RepID=UPI0024A19472|nr:ABC transporter ATP-binding protein [Lentzea sp. NBRC 105346]GLZ29037.1 daunorubicin resistance protein DrrA family ABC transporter ATP-binding protein [Lentzea sp. NBRC 105346]
MIDEYAVEITALRRVFATGKGLRKRGPGHVALDGVDLAVRKGEVHGLLGPNGAGKTTLCKILSTVLLPTSGTAKVLGFDVVGQTSRVRESMGIVFGGERGLYGRLTARQNLKFWGALHGLHGKALRTRVDTLLERVGLTGRADDRVEGFSRGMKQRVHLARGLVGDPAVLLLDEPTTGMDPVAAKDFRSLVGELRAENRTVLITTHDMVEAEQVCDRVSLIDAGRILATEPPAALSEWITRFERVDVPAAPAEVVARLRELPGVGSVSTEDGRVRFETTQEGVAAQLVRALVDEGVTSVTTSKPSLEEVYLHVFGHNGMAVRK